MKFSWDIQKVWEWNQFALVGDNILSMTLFRIVNMW